MGFLDKLRKLLAGRPAAPTLDIVVRCGRCGEVIRAQINLYNDLSAHDDRPGVAYYCRKGVVGTGLERCFQEIVTEHWFDAGRNVVERRASGGDFVEEREW